MAASAPARAPAPSVESPGPALRSQTRRGRTTGGAAKGGGEWKSGRGSGSEPTGRAGEGEGEIRAGWRAGRWGEVRGR